MEYHAIFQPFHCYFPDVMLAELDSFRDRFVMKDLLRISDASFVTVKTGNV